MEVTTEEELQSIEDNNIKLTDDISLTENFTGFDEYTKIFDGNGHTISNLTTSFIKKITEDAIFKNVTFKNVCLTDTPAIIEWNNGTIKSVTVSNYTNNSHENKVGVVKDNRSRILDCTLKDSSLYGDEEVGGFIGNDHQGFIQDCTVENGFICASSEIGGIIGDSISTTIQNSVVTDSCIRGRYMIGGAVGRSKESSISKTTVINSNIEAIRSTGGILGEGDKKISIRDCKVQETQICSKDTIYCVGDVDARGEIKGSSVSDCKIITKDKNTNIHIFSDSGSVTNSFITDSLIYSQNVTLSATNSKIKHSYADIEIRTQGSVEQDVKNISTFYTTVTVSQPEEPKTVTVSEKSDLENINVLDTIQLKQDINLENTEFSSLIRFNGTLNGNGHTIFNMKGSLFRHTEAEFTDLTIQNADLSDFKYTGIVTQSAVNTTFDNITVIQNTQSNTLSNFSGISNRISKSEIRNCTININTELEDCVFSGVADLVQNSKLRDTKVELNISNTEKTSGVSRLVLNSKVVGCQTTGSISVQKTDVAGLGFNIENESRLYQSQSDITIKSEHVNETDQNQKISGLISLNKGKVQDCEFTGEIHSKSSVGEDEPKSKTHNTKNINYNVFGGIVGKNEGSIINCTNRGLLKIDGINIGGIAGKCSSEITNCTNNGLIQGKRNVGGIVGSKVNSSITKSSNQNKVSGEEKIGGLIGVIKGELKVNVENCYVTESIEGDLLIGTIENPSLDHDIFNLYWASELEQESVYGQEYTDSIQSINTILRL